MNSSADIATSETAHTSVARRPPTSTALAGMSVAAVLALSGCSAPAAPTVSGVPDGLPSVSSPIAIAPDGATVWVVNPDADSITAVDAAALSASATVQVGDEPWSVAVSPGGAVVVVNRASGTLTLLLGGERRDVRLGSEPGGVALSPTGRYAFVSLASDAAVAVVDLEAPSLLGRVSVGAMPWAVAVTDDGDLDDADETVVVTHHLSRLAEGGREGVNDGKEAWVTRLPAGDMLTATSTRDDGPLGTATEVSIEPYDFGYPNGLEAVALQDGEAYVAHLLNQPEYPRDFEHTVSAAVSSVPVVGQPSATAGGDHPRLRLHLNDESFSTPVNHPSAIALANDGRTAYVVLGGSDAVMGIDLAGTGGPQLIGFWPAGSNPRGIVLSRDGERAYVMNFLSRDVSVLDLEDRAARQETARVQVVDETLTSELLAGKVLFHNASSARISQLGWIACASCHLGGGSDGTTWQTPDGPRQTMPLWELEGTAPYHASATRDEVQDFERDIEELMAGSGLAPGAYRRELGEPNGGLSPELDALASYVLSGIRTPRAPETAPAAVAEGRELFAGLGCAACHGGSAWTLSSLPGPVGSLAPNGETSVTSQLRDVGTFDLDTDVLGAAGFDVPQLLGLHATAPYLHDGSAQGLEEVLSNEAHVGQVLSAAQVAALTEFLRSIDAATEPL